MPSDQPGESSSLIDSSIFQGHLHPLTIAFGVWKGLRGSLPIIPLIYFGNRFMGAGLLLFILGSTILTSLVRYFSLSYRIEGGELITEHGILQRNTRHIPLERVQEIRIEQGVLHRLLDVVDAKVETGGGEGAEAVLSVLSKAEAERLRQAVFERAAAIKAAEPAEPLNIAPPPAAIVHQLSHRDLLLAGFTTNHLVSVMIAIGAFFNFADDIFPDTFYKQGAEYGYRTSRYLLGQDAWITLGLALVAMAIVFLLGAAFSMARAIVVFHGFTLSLCGEDLHRRYGLLTRRSSSLPRRRIQVLEIEEKMLRRFFRLATLRVDTAGGKKENEEDRQGRDVLMPIVDRAEVPRLLGVIFPTLDPEPVEWRGVSKLSIWRGTVKGGLFCLLLATAFYFLHRESLSILTLLAIPLVWWGNVLRYRWLGYFIGERFVWTRRGWLGRSTHVVPIEKIQAVEVLQSPVDRRLGIASLHIDTAGQAYTGGGPHIDCLPREEAMDIARLLSHQAAITHYRW